MRIGEIVKVGNGIPTTVNAPHYWPVQFEDGSFGILTSPSGPTLVRWGGDGGEELNDAVRNSANMPKVFTLGSGSVTIAVTREDGAAGFIQTFYGAKESRETDNLVWTSK